MLIQASLDTLFGDGTAEQLTAATADALGRRCRPDTITGLDELLPESQPVSGEAATNIGRGLRESCSLRHGGQSLDWGNQTMFAASED